MKDYNESIINILSQAVQQPSIDIQVSGVVNTGTGVSLEVISPILIQLHSELVRQLDDVLIARDKCEYLPHITIQNKVTAFKAFKTAEELNHSFKPQTIQATGLCCWEIEKGNWKLIQTFSFSTQLLSKELE